MLLGHVLLARWHRAILEEAQLSLERWDLDGNLSDSANTRTFSRRAVVPLDFDPILVDTLCIHWRLFSSLRLPIFLFC